ncbi:Spy/CpxP family protein refolding chaperone [Ottowia sp.]|uniref:Spy/CpxP family protein refolding chaperone n=1 Tax=Ottowia sp. TaxID=1898956 RepID=UPI003A89B6E6
MSSTLQRLILATTLAAASPIVLAQSAPPAPPAPAPAFKSVKAIMGDEDEESKQSEQERRLERANKRFERTMDTFKRQLKITPAQEPAWSSFQAAMRPSFADDYEYLSISSEELAPLTAPEQIDLTEKRRADRQAVVLQRGKAIKAFYTQLTPYQQGAFDTYGLRRLMGSGWPRY